MIEDDLRTLLSDRAGAVPDNATRVRDVHARISGSGGISGCLNADVDGNGNVLGCLPVSNESALTGYAKPAWQMGGSLNIPNDGVRVSPRYIRKVEDHSGRILEEDYPQVHDVISARTARVMTSSRSLSIGPLRSNSGLPVTLQAGGV